MVKVTKWKWRRLILSATVYLVFYLPPVSCYLSLNGCPEFQDLRKNSSENSFEYVIGPEEAPYYQIIKHNTSILDECEITVSRYVNLNDEANQTFINEGEGVPRFYNGFIPQKFTTDGDYFDGYHYFQKSEYCVKTISDVAIELKVCQPICNTAAATRNCIPKCCPPDKILGYWSFRCIQLFQEEPRWKPLLCNGEHCAQQNPSESIHFHEHSIKYTCQSIYLRHPSKTMELIVPGVVYDLEKKQNIRLDTSQGRIQLQQLNIERKWEDYNVDFCADGFVRSGSEPYTGAIENQVIITCKDDEPEIEEISHDVENWASIITQLLGCVLMLTTVVIYLVLLKQQNFNGLMILSYASSSFFSYVFSAAAHFIAVSDDPRALGFAERGALCMVIAIAIQFFHYGTYAWLTVMNYNLWQTLKSLNSANTGASKRLKTFVLFSCLAWGFSGLLVGFFAVFDEIYRDPLTYVIVPDYAVESCSTATHSRGYFIYIPTAIILVVNGLLTLLTLKVIIEAKINAAKMAKTGADRYTARLFFKLFFLMGVVCFLTMLLWYYNSYARPWYVSVVKLIIQLDSIPLFILFSCNDRILAQLQDKFPILEGFFKFFKEMKLPTFTTQTSVVD